MIRLAEDVYRLEAGGFVNSYLIVGDRDLTLVDAGTSRGAIALIRELKGNGFTLDNVGRVVVTHAHADHAGGLARLLEKRPIKVFAHPADIPILTGRVRVPPFRGVFGVMATAALEQVTPWRPIEGALPIEPGTPVRGLPQWQVLHTPGHTAGSISLYEPARQILLCGDLLSNRGGRLHPVTRAFNQDADGVRASIGMVAKMDVDILGCGHGPEVRGGAFRHIEKLVRA